MYYWIINIIFLSILKHVEHHRLTEVSMYYTC